MTKFHDLQPIGRAYVVVVVATGVITLAASIGRLWVEPIGSQWLVLAALTLLTGSFTVKVPSINASLSVSETFVFASVLLFGPHAGAVTVLLECLIILFWMSSNGRSLHLVLFNTAAPAISIWLSGTVFFFLSGIPPYSQGSTPLPILFLPLLTFTVLYFLLNSWLVAFAVGFETKQSAAHIWWNNFTWLSVNYFSGASVAALLVTYTPSHALDLSTLAIIVPLLVVSYLTFRTAMGRVEDSNKHLSELNRLYLSTIETLAMAIDAKDQITHGHIRRVQAYAVNLAKRLGVTDHDLLKAIEAAALLHDMGKLAVPEYILSKPGKLTDAEFDKMKLHASVGADILTAIGFPYPVVPIVRHHHENWDGTGYPDGLKGTEIPIGARILSVVDCFDALTSDRPYRPRLPDEEALRILVGRSGTMYDPLIVDEFIRIHSDVSVPLPSTELPRHVLSEITGSSQHALDNPSLDEISASTGETALLYEMTSALTKRASTQDAYESVVNHLRRLIPASQAALLTYDPVSDELTVKHASGSIANSIIGLRIPRGQRLSGWVAANRRTISNSDPVLDLGDIARTTTPRLRSCLSTCLVDDDSLVGVLTLYSESVNGFNDDHGRVLEVVASHIAPVFNLRSQPTSDVTREAGLQSTDDERATTITRLVPSGTHNDTVIVVDIQLTDVEVNFGLDFCDDVLSHATRKIRTVLGSNHLLFRSKKGTLIAVLRNTESNEARRLCDRIRAAVRSEPAHLRNGQTVVVECAATCVSETPDVDSARELIHSAEFRRRPNLEQVH